MAGVAVMLLPPSAIHGIRTKNATLDVNFG
jgi:hypothetical protein